jgi:hypothetical protein
VEAWKEALRLEPGRQSVDKKIQMRQIPENWAIFENSYPFYAEYLRSCFFVSIGCLRS